MSAVQEHHARLEVRSGSVYLTALHGDPENIRSKSYTWLNGAPLRPGLSCCAWVSGFSGQTLQMHCNGGVQQWPQLQNYMKMSTEEVSVKREHHRVLLSFTMALYAQ